MSIHKFWGSKQMSLSIAAGIVGAATLLVACSDSDKGGDNDASSLEERVKSNYVDIAYSVYSDSLTTAQALQQSIDTFLAAPTQDNLTAARAAYKTARMPYQQSEIYRWDTDITLSSSTGDAGIASVDDWEGQVNAWPLDESLIDYVDDGAGSTTAGFIIGGIDEITEALLVSANGDSINGLTGDAAEANVATGVHAIEFLLWGQDLNGIGPGAGSRPATDYAMDATCTNENCDRRRQYLKVVSDLLVSDLEAMVAEWSPAAEDAVGTLANNYLNSNLSFDYMLLSMFNMMTDELASARMGAGLELFDPEEEHDCFSDLSHVAIYHNYQGIKNTFYGTYVSPVGGNDIVGPGFGDLIRNLDASIYENFDATLSRFETEMKVILDLGEMPANSIRFDQIIGEGLITPQGGNYVRANATSKAMAQLNEEIEGVKGQFDMMQELLSLTQLPAEGGGDGD